jgi:hypothetical protein
MESVLYGTLSLTINDVQVPAFFAAILW